MSEQGQEAQEGARIYRRLLGYSAAYWRGFGLAALAMIVYAGSDAAVAWAVKPLLDGGFVERDPKIISVLPWAIVGLFLVRALASFGSTYGIAWVGQCLTRDLRREVFTHLLHSPTSYYDQASSGHLLNTLTYKAQQVLNAGSNAVTVVVRDSFAFIFLVGVLLYHSWVLTLVFFVFAPLLGLIIVKLTGRFRHVARNTQHFVGQLTHVAEEAIEGHAVVKTFAGHDQEKRSFSRANERVRQYNLKMTAAKAIGMVMVELLAASGLAAVMYLAMRLATEDMMTPGQFASFLAALLFLHKPVRRLMAVNVDIQKGIAAAESIFALLDMAPEKDTGTIACGRAEGRVEYDAVRFRYPSAREDALNGLSFTVEPGQMAAFVGRSGSGKTTLVSLLPRFYDVGSGMIRLDGRDVRTLTLESLRAQMALVGQHVTLFNDTIRNNIAYGSLKNASEEDILRAAEMAHAWEFIREQPEGMDTIVGEDGVLLSGGQRQRLAIARALLKDAPILVLDEATSALDSESERYIQEGLERLMHNRTTLIIAHRLSTIKKADVIFVMEAGAIVETGTHDELLGRGGLYASLYNMHLEKAARTGHEVTL